MKIESKPTLITTSTLFKEMEFGIKSSDMGLVLEILRSKLYSNPIGAICREVASNSRDANRESENTVPIEIAINNSSLSMSDMTISFKDHGPGISPQRMADVFVNYGSSTKRDTDEFTGGFGLGAKTPFSYTDNFTIETIVDGVKYTYVAAIEEGRKGKIYCIDTVEIDEHSGTTIVIPIKQYDRRTFEEEVYKATIFWDIKPIYKNFNKKLENIMFDTKIGTEDFLVIKQDLLTPGYGLLLDGIYYPINYSQIDFAGYTISNYSIIFKFNINELTISANRETLQYDEKTKTAINKKFSVLMTHCMTEYEKTHNEAKTWLEAITSKKNRETNVFYMIINMHLSKTDPYREKIDMFKGKKLSTKIDAQFQTFSFYYIQRSTDVRSLIEKTTRVKITEILPDFNTQLFYFIDEKTFTTAKDATIFSNSLGYIAIKPIDPMYLNFSDLTFKNKKTFAKNMRLFLKEIELLKELGFNFNLYSNVEKIKIDKTNLGKTQKTIQTKPETIKVFEKGICSNQGVFTYLKVNGPDVTYESGTILNKEEYILVLVDDILCLPSFTEEFDMLRIAIKAKLLPSFKLIFANKKRGTKLQGLISENWKKHTDAVTPDIISHIIDTNNVKNLLSYSNDWVLSISFISKKFSNLIETLKTYSSSVDLNIPEYVKTKYQSFSKIGNITEQWKDMFKTFPLLSNLSYNPKSIVNDITKYVNLMENELISNNTLI